MSLITEEQRKELGEKSNKELAELIGEHRKDINDKSVAVYVSRLKSALRQPKLLFDTLADTTKTSAEKAKELHVSKLTITAYLSALRSIGAIQSCLPGPSPSASLDEKILTVMTGPLTNEEIAKAVGTNRFTINQHLRELRDIGEIEMFKISVGADGRKFRFYGLFDKDKLSPSTYLSILANNDEHKRKLGERIASAIKVDEIDGTVRGISTAITMHLKNAKFPKEVVEIVREKIKRKEIK